MDHGSQVIEESFRFQTYTMPMTRACINLTHGKQFLTIHTAKNPGRQVGAFASQLPIQKLFNHLENMSHESTHPTGR